MQEYAEYSRKQMRDNIEHFLINAVVQQNFAFILIETARKFKKNSRPVRFFGRQYAKAVNKSKSTTEAAAG